MGKHKKTSPRFAFEPRKNDWRKSVSLRRDQVEKRRKAGKNGRGKNALTSKAAQQRLDEQARIDAIVKRSKAQEATSGVDVIRVNTSVWRMKGSRVG